MGFYNTNSRAFEGFLRTLDALPNSRLIYQIIDQVILERYPRAISYDLSKPLS